MNISIHNLSKEFGNPPRRVLHDITFDISSGEFVALTGRSGSGKSTLLYIMSTLDMASNGTVKIDKKLTSNMNAKELHQFRNLYMGFVFQFHYLLPELTSLENVLMPAIKTGQEKVRRERAQKLLFNFGLNEKLHRLPSQLSGGEQQRVAIARALIMNPRLIFADEPTGNLDSTNGDRVMEILKEINREEGSTIIYVTHDSTYAALAGRKIHLVDGRVQS